MSEKFPSIWQATLLVLANILLTGVAVVVLYVFQPLLGLSLPQHNALATLLGSGSLLAWVVHRNKMDYGTLLHPNPSSVVATTALLVPAILLLTPMLVLLDVGLTTFLEMLWPLSAWEQRLFALMADGSLSTLLWVCALAPALEEMLFRGILLRGFLHRYSRWYAISLSALFFGVAHLNVYQFVVAFLLGLLLGWLYERSRSLIPCIALHAAFNTGVTLGNMGGAPDTELQLSDIPLWVWSLSALAAMLSAVLLMRVLAVRRGPQNTASS